MHLLCLKRKVKSKNYFEIRRIGIFVHLSSREMSTPTVCTGLSMLDLITEAKFLRMSFMALHPTEMYLKHTKMSLNLALERLKD